jgi:GntR family transcriptional regulator / MocR family aminotransferase
MTKQAGTFDLVLPRRKKGTTAQGWLCEGLRTEILRGGLRPGSQLPASRDLAAQYGVSRGTVVIAFEQLKAEGYLEGNVGSGTFVSEVLPEELLQVRRKGNPEIVAKPARRPQGSAYARRVDLFPNFENRPTRAFRANLPALDLFPTTLWAQVAARRLRRVSTNLLMGCEAMGYLPLRRAVSDYLTSSRGVRCKPEQIAIVSGVQEAIDVVTRLFISPGDRVCVENPGYPGAAIVFEAAGATLVNGGLDDEGLQLREKRLDGVRLVYVTPGHQFPTGVTMSVARRMEWLDWAARTGSLILEDDYDSEFRYSGLPVPAMQGLDRHGVVLFTGSFSKVLFPSLRLGYLVVPEDLVDRVAATLSVTSRHAPLLEQAVVCDFITDGHFGRHLRRMRQVYAERLSVLMESAREHLRGVLYLSDVQAGLQTTADLRVRLLDEDVAKSAAKRNVEVIPVTRYATGGWTPSTLQLGFAAIDVKEIRRGVRDLAIAIEELRAARRDWL